MRTVTFFFGVEVAFSVFVLFLAVVLFLGVTSGFLDGVLDLVEDVVLTVGFLVVETFGGVRTFLSVVAFGVGLGLAAKTAGAPRN